MTSVLLLGGNGMLGSMISTVFREINEISLVRTIRNCNPRSGEVYFDASKDEIESVLRTVNCEWVVNAIGVLSSQIKRSNPATVTAAIHANALLPNQVALAAQSCGTRVLHVSTDGVFSGIAGPYDEKQVADDSSIYGRTKILGEVTAQPVTNIRCSIIGPESARNPVSLLDRTLKSGPGTRLVGYRNQHWNGVTTLHLAKALAGIIQEGTKLPPTMHFVPADSVTKVELLESVTRAFGRADIKICASDGPERVDRRLATCFPEENTRIWTAAGYKTPPTIEAMVSELAGAKRSETSRAT